MYVDLDFRNEETGMEEKFIEHAINVGNSVFRFSTIDQRSKDNSPIRDFEESNKYVLKGSAGQGKSTVCQFLAQIYRANFLKNFSTTPNPKIEEFLNRIEDNNYTPSCLRVPVRIELRLYSAWMIRRKSENQSDEDDARNDGVEKLNEYLKLLLDSSQKDIEYNIWQNHIRTLAFLVLSKKEWFKYPDMLFPEPKNKRPRKYPSYFAEKDTETIIKNMVSYVSWSENMSALEFLIEFILSEMTYEMFVKIDWNSLEDVNSIKTQCLLALSNIKKEQDVEEKLLPLLSDDIANEFVFKLASSMRLPERFLPLYIYYLNQFRQENNTQYVFDLEKTIVSYINIIPVDLEDFLLD